MDWGLFALLVVHVAVGRPGLGAGPGTVPGRSPRLSGRARPRFWGLRTRWGRQARLRRERLDRVDDLGADAQLALEDDLLPGADRPVPRMGRGVPAQPEAAELVADLVGPGRSWDADMAEAETSSAWAGAPRRFARSSRSSMRSKRAGRPRGGASPEGGRDPIMVARAAARPRELDVGRARSMTRPR